MSKPDLKFITNKTIATAQHIFVDVEVNVGKVLESWRESLFSFEWLDQDGNIKSEKDLSDRERPKRQEVEALLKNNQPIERPILGLGINDHVEIGSGRAILLTLADHGYDKIEVHIPKSNKDDFKKYMA